ncbi:uncharacterized protein LOC129877112 [Solanum dulcamara]|uniref:uncharacterized protein LOC129877112 n=1 Tax=Solanum dulcamara TaxID=45834 RepID=UPI002485C378|nr:uncharacterized protein LOC129877112 [Solanum dulcamara]
MALKVVVVLFLAMLVFTDHKFVAGQFCVAGCVANFKSADSFINCLIDCNRSCPLDCITKFSASRDIMGLLVCVGGCLSPFTTISDEVATLNPTTTVCNVGCSLGICSKYLNDLNDKFGPCMTSCKENHCIGGKIALEEA